MKNNYAYVLVILLFLVTSCAQPQSNTGKGGLYGSAGGAAVGAALGQAIGGDTEGTLWGAAIGAAVGGLAGAGVGKMMDNQERDMRAALAASEAATVRREGNLLSILFKSDMTFDFNSATIRPGLYTELDRIANVIRQYPDTLIRVEGHTDSTGSEQYNMDLSKRRTQSVGDLLAQRYVSTSRTELIGFGETMPIASNETEAGRQMNRRVEIKVAPTTTQP